MNRHVADTNTLIYFLNKVGGREYRHRFDGWIRDGLVISVITRIEVLSWPEYGNQSDLLTEAKTLLAMVSEEPLIEPVAEKAIAIRRNYRLKLPDALVAATAEHLALPLITRNTDDFKRVPGLTLVNPFS